MKMSADAIVKGYRKVCSDYYKKFPDDSFIEKLFSHLSEQQNQCLRKLSKPKRIKPEGKKGVWEHPIPVKYSRDILIGYIKSGDQIKINSYIDFIWANTYQVFLEEKWDGKLRACGLRDTMPTDWNWEVPGKNNVFQRYLDTGIPKEECC